MFPLASRCPWPVRHSHGSPVRGLRAGLRVRFPQPLVTPARHRAELADAPSVVGREVLVALEEERRHAPEALVVGPGASELDGVGEVDVAPEVAGAVPVPLVELFVAFDEAGRPIRFVDGSPDITSPSGDS